MLGFIGCYGKTKYVTVAVVVDQLVERLLPTSEVRGLNLLIGKFYIDYLFTLICIVKTNIKKKEAGNGLFNKL